MEEALLVICWVVPIAVAIYLAADAATRGRSAVGWGLVGLFLGPLGLIIWLIKRPPRRSIAGMPGQTPATPQQPGVYIPATQKRMKKDVSFWGMLSLAGLIEGFIIVSLFTVDPDKIVGMLGFAAFVFICLVCVLLLNRQLVYVCPACNALLHEGKLGQSSLRLSLGRKCPVCGVKFWAD